MIRDDINRRDWIQRMAGVAALTGLGESPGSWIGPPPVAIARPGIQLYTLRSEMKKSVEATVAKVAQLGFKELEFAGYFKRTPAQIAALLKANGLTAPSAHVDRNAIGKGWPNLLDLAARIGHQWVVVAYIPDADRASADSYKRLAGEFNTAAAAAKQRGISFAYHNHDFEFAALGNTNGHAVLLKECDPALVQFELDLYWITKARHDVAAYVARHPGRFPLVHVKDMMADGSMTEVGSGTIDFQKIFTAAKGGIKHFFVENDNPTVPFESVGKSVQALRRLSP